MTTADCLFCPVEGESFNTQRQAVCPLLLSCQSLSYSSLCPVLTPTISFLHSSIQKVDWSLMQ